MKAKKNRVPQSRHNRPKSSYDAPENVAFGQILMKILSGEKEVPCHRIDHMPTKLVTFEELKKISDRNFGRFNRCINPEGIWNDIKDKPRAYQKFRLKPALEHHHHMGKPVDMHYRCIVSHPEMQTTAFQDVAVEQFERIHEKCA